MRRIEIRQRRARIGRSRTGQRVDESEGWEKERRKSVRTRDTECSWEKERNREKVERKRKRKGQRKRGRKDSERDCTPRNISIDVF